MIRESKAFLHKAISLCLCFILVFISLGTPTAQALVGSKQYPPNNIDLIINSVPKGERWLTHLKDDLLPFWTMDTAKGFNGNFPTYRCNDGSLFDLDNLCTELKEPIPGIVKLDREYVRSKSRQTFAYGVAYNMTGDIKYLKLAKAGVDYLRANALDPNGGAYTYFENGKGKPEQAERISQDMTYALSGLAFYYYLTRDEDVLRDIVKVKNYIFNTYYDKELDLIAWTKQDYTDYVNPDGVVEEVKANQRELVAQLDQVYAYMMLLTPILPDTFDGVTIKANWEKDLVHLATIMSEQFYTPDKNIFWGAITDNKNKKLGTDHTDFGHSIKTLWLIYEIGKLTGHYDLVLFTQEAAPKIFEAAYLEDGTWGRRINEYGQTETDKEWWILAELDQVAATFSLRDPSYAKYLPTTYAYWFEYMVDHQNKGVWHWVNAADNKPNIHFPKQHSWKNAFHTFEHAIVGYLTGQELHDLNSELYFAFQKVPADKTKIRPYMYAAKVNYIEDIPSTPKDNGFKKQKVTFTDLR